MYYQNQKYYLVPLTKEEVEKLQNLRNKEENEKNVKTSSDELIEPLDALVKGNILKNEYRPYKNYSTCATYITDYSDEKEKLMGEIMIYSNAAHDLSLKLDIFPERTELLYKFDEYALKANNLIKEYESKYGPLKVNALVGPKNEYSWLKTPSVWEN